MVHANAVVSTLWEKHSLSYLVLLLGVGPKDCLGPCDLTIDQGLSAHPARETALMRSQARLYNPAAAHYEETAVQQGKAVVANRHVCVASRLLPRPSVC